ncbi:unnamed protein product [Moneuplotes crassus]|uniref:Uncharacterized protein n=1 Tax=Euplotes crassus TaxID=5936 RepID=A0AAD2D872_EUPCR|nr:unnamed protein product [Moneuplotes crassus]
MGSHISCRPSNNEVKKEKSKEVKVAKSKKRIPKKKGQRSKKLSRNEGKFLEDKSTLDSDKPFPYYSENQPTFEASDDEGEENFLLPNYKRRQTPLVTFMNKYRL